jgi:murein DD-endopeptidase MepM/ murein hydrolase activator NlpD
MDSLRQRAWSRVNLLFPERQIYIRSEGRVQFLTFSSQIQVIMAGISLLFLGWVAFTSVNVIFKDRILAAKERHFQRMQTSYESRIADLQLSYDELNGALVIAQDRFKAVADSFEAKQQALAAVIEHKKTLQASLGIGAPAPKDPPLSITLRPLPPSHETPGMGGAFDAINADSEAALTPPSSAGFGPVSPPKRAVDATLPRPERGAQHDELQASERPGFLEGAVGKLGSLFRRKISSNDFDHPVVKESAAQSARIVRLELGQSALLGEAAQDVDKETTRLTRALKATGIDANTLMKRVTAGAGQGGPLIPIESADIGSTDESFNASLADAATAIAKLDGVVTALNALPLGTPSEAGSLSSGFGARIDPFNEQLAFHSGVDFSGPSGAAVRATASGIVVFAGPQGAYGNTVEVDHGYGIRTRYGHLSKILVQVGTPLDKGAIIGKLGSTGRSTGPHVHYEVWYDNAVRDPSKFIKAGHYVLED